MLRLASLANWPIRDSVAALYCLHLDFLLASTMLRDSNYCDGQDIGNNPIPY